MRALGRRQCLRIDAADTLPARRTERTKRPHADVKRYVFRILCQPPPPTADYGNTSAEVVGRRQL